MAPVPSRGIASRRDSPIRLRICVTAVSLRPVCLGMEGDVECCDFSFWNLLGNPTLVVFFFESILEMKQIGYNVSLGFKI